MRALTSIAVSTLCVVAAVQRVAAHGYLVWPPPLGYEKVTYNEDALKAPTSPDNICRGEPIGNEATPVGHQLVLKFKPTAPHIGPCQVFIMNDDHSNPIHVGNKTNCAAPGVDPTWSITLPAHIRGNKLLRWTWEGCHVTPCEHYEQCAPIIIGGGAADSTPSHDDGYGSSPQPKPKPKPITDVPVVPAYPSAPAYPPATPAPIPDISVVPPPAPPVAPAYPQAPAPAYSATPAPAPIAVASPAPAPAYPVAPAEDKTSAPPAKKPCNRSRTSFNGDSCTHGDVRCRGNAVAKCDHDKWVYFPCGSGLSCINGDSVPTCGLLTSNVAAPAA